MHTLQVAELEFPHHLHRDRAKLNVCKCFSDTAVTAGPKWQIRARCTFGDETVAVIDLVVLGEERFAGVKGRAGVPAVRLPGVRIREVGGRFRSDAGGGKENVGRGDGIRGIRDVEGGFDFA